MGYLLGIDTGGTYTDAVLLDEGATRVVASAKALTSRPDLARGIGAAIDAVLAAAGVGAAEVALVSLSTTLATNALVEGQGGRIALVAIGFSEAELARAGLADALKGDPVIRIEGGHGHDGGEARPLDLPALASALLSLPPVTGFAVAASFATRNPAHERAARDLIRDRTGRPVTTSHELSAALNGPKRALTAVLNARLSGRLARLIDACEGQLARRGVAAPRRGGRGDGARGRPVEPRAGRHRMGSLDSVGTAGVHVLDGVEGALCTARLRHAAAEATAPALRCGLPLGHVLADAPGGVALRALAPPPRTAPEHRAPRPTGTG